MNVEWYTVKAHVDKQIQAAQLTLETCDLDKVEYYRGRIHALRSVQNLAQQQPESDGVAFMPSNF